MHVEMEVTMVIEMDKTGDDYQMAPGNGWGWRRVRMVVSWRISLTLGSVTGTTVGTCDISRILSAISDSCCSEKSADEDARTMRTDGGRRCKNSCLTNALLGAGPVAQQMLHVTQQLRGLAISHFLGCQELLKAALLGCLGALDEGFFKPVVWAFRWRV